MAHLNIKERVIETKVVYYGAGLSGKTTNLEQIKRLSVGGKCGELMSVDTDGDRTLFFDWLPMQIGKFNGCDVKVQLFTVPGQAKYAETRKKVLAGADGVILVLDSQSGALERNVQVLNDLREHLREHKLENLPIVVQLNKRDLPTALPIDELLSFVGVGALPHVPASAATGEGVFETLREMIRHVLMHVRDQARDSSGDIRAGTESALDGHTLYGQISDGMANAPALAVRPEAPGSKVAAKTDVAATSDAVSSPAAAPVANAETERGTLVSMEARSYAPAAKVANGDRYTDVAARTAYSTGVASAAAEGGQSSVATNGRAAVQAASPPARDGRRPSAANRDSPAVKVRAIRNLQKSLHLHARCSGGSTMSKPRWRSRSRTASSTSNASSLGASVTPSSNGLPGSWKGR
jgi:small GTP-binding protein